MSARRRSGDRDPPATKHHRCPSSPVNLIITRLRHCCRYSYRQVSTRGRREKNEARAAARISSVSVPGSQPSHICNSNAVACAATTGLRRTQLHLYLLRLGVSDSRWGCGPIRRRLLEDDEWGRLRGAREEWRHRQTGDAHSCLGE